MFTDALQRRRKVETMADQAVFKTAAFGGFDKASVLGYIDQLNQAAQNAQAELQKKITSLEGQNRELSGQLEEKRKKMMDLENALQAEQAKSRETNSLVNNLNLEIARQGKALEEKCREVRLCQEKCRQFQFKAEAMEYKAQKFDEASLDIGTVILEARQTANGILEEAEVKAKEITSDAEQRLRAAYQDMEKLQGGVTDLRRMIDSAVETLDGDLSRIDASLAGTAGCLKSYLENQQEKASEEETSSEKAAEEEHGGEEGENAEQGPAEAPVPEEKAFAGEKAFF